MRVFGVSDIHVDYQENKKWLSNLSSVDYIDDVLILAGDMTDELKLLETCFNELSTKFLKVLFVPGNHELWVKRDKVSTSIEKYYQVEKVAKEYGIATGPVDIDTLTIVPLLGWYDFSFGSPSAQLEEVWMDFRACVWPGNMSPAEVTDYFHEKNEKHLCISNETIISFSHFLPRIDLMPFYIPESYRYIYPALGSSKLEKQIRALNPDIHLYGHSHVNRDVKFDGIRYINNAFGYPSEYRISSKSLFCIYEC